MESKYQVAAAARRANRTISCRQQQQQQGSSEQLDAKQDSDRWAPRVGGGGESADRCANFSARCVDVRKTSAENHQQVATRDDEQQQQQVATSFGQLAEASAALEQAESSTRPQVRPLMGAATSTSAINSLRPRRSDQHEDAATILEPSRPPSKSAATATTTIETIESLRSFKSTAGGGGLLRPSARPQAIALAAAVMIPLILVHVLLLAASQAAASEQEAPSSRTRQHWTDQRNANTTTGANIQRPFGELLAIGAISLLDGNDAAGKQPSARLLDRIELAPAPGGGAENSSLPVDKLQYIIEFMRQNKLSKFCDLLTSERVEIKRLRERLNSLDQFTLFVPTDEAMLLTLASQIMDQIRGSATETKQFLLAHATSELVTPAATLGAGTSNQLMFSLSGVPMRVTAGAGGKRAGGRNATGEPALIVNGANILQGQSYALQEQNNASATYAIVHLIDRPLYPATSNLRLLDLLRAVAPSMARYLDKDPALLSELVLEAPKRLTTVLAPSEAAFNQIRGSKLGARLDSNQTFLRDFIRGHLLDGLHYTGQFDTSDGAPATRLMSLAGTELEFESRKLQSRIVLLVDSVPIVEPDLVASNGVIHLLAQPLVGRKLLDDCNCGSSPAETRTGAPNSVIPIKPEVDASALWNVRPTPAATLESNELEREESRVEPGGSGGAALTSGQRIRAQRSGSGLVARNNRDFYRPSAAPANLLMSQQQQQDSRGSSEQASNLQPTAVHQRFPTKMVVEQPKQPEANIAQVAPLSDVPPVSFDGVERYKIVLDANSRQRMREQIRALSDQPHPVFNYDRPSLANSSNNNNASPATTGVLLQQQDQAQLRRPYSELINATGAPPASASGWTIQDQMSQAATSRQQRLLKFQIEDARPQELNDTATYQTLNPAGKAAGVEQQPGSGPSKTSAAPPGFSGCAFYDADCKRLVGRLVRLPVIRNRHQQKSIGQDPLLSQNNSQVHPSRPMHHNSADPHLDSTFGETTEQPSLRLSAPTTRPPALLLQQPQQQRPFQDSGKQAPLLSRLTSSVSRASPLNQPLPPWNDEAAQLAASWRAQDKDIARITVAPGANEYPPGFTGGISRQQAANNKTQLSARQQQQQPPPAEQIFLTPVKVIQLQELSHSATKSAVANLTNGAMFVAPAPIMRNSLAAPMQHPARVSFGSSARLQQFHTPTPYSVNLATTHMPSMFSQNQQPISNNNNILGRPTNFTALEPIHSTFDGVEPALGNKQVMSSLQRQPLKAPVAAIRRPSARPLSGSQLLQRELDAERKNIRSQQAANQQMVFNEDFTGDFSITSAKLSNQSQMSTQASDQTPNVSANFIRSVPSGDEQNVEFFQDRSIAEIMDDSGLRIDGQQVTFSRLKECLVDAGLLSLTTQTGGSLTIFMPTDAAFQRLVAQQAAMQQLLAPQPRSRLTASGFQSNRLSKQPATDGRIPLLARPNGPGVAPSSRLVAATGSGGELTSVSGQDALNSAADRLTLDCGTDQVRQLLLDHLSARMVTPKQLQADMSVSSLSGRQLLLSSVPSKKIVIVDGQPVIAATRAKNGMVYVVNKFLNLTQQMPNVVELMTTQPNLTTFLSYLSFSKLSDRIKRETGPITILAPTNEAFEQLSASARQLINSDPSALADVLRGHIVEGAQFGKLISMRNQLKTMNPDQIIDAKVIKPNVYLLDNQMTSMRLVGTTGNGVVNLIDRLIVPGWLRASMGSAARTQQPGGTGSSSVESTNLPSMLISGELGDPAASSGHRTQQQPGATMNLPLLNGRPTRFEQAGARSTPGRVSTNSFQLAGANELSGPSSSRDRSTATLDRGSNNIELLNDFGGILPSTNNNNGNSPFSRIASSQNTTTGGLAPKQRRTGIEPSPAVAAAAPASGNMAANVSGSSNNSSSSSSSSRNMQLIEKLAHLMQAHKFVKFLAGSKLGQLLKAGMNYVVLMPSDEAVDKLPMQILDLLERQPERLADLAHYHVLETTFDFINNIPDGQTLNSINEKDIIFNWHKNNSLLTASGAIIKGGIQEDNIALLLVDRVLYPTPGDILNIVAKSPILSNFTSLLQSAGLESQLSLAGPFTLFAPSDLAFLRMDKRDLEFMQRNRDTARRFLLRHMSQPVVFTSAIELSNSTSLPRPQSSTSITNTNQLARQQLAPVPTLTISNMLGEDLALRKVDDFFSVNDINISYADVAATNGIVHVIDGIL